MSPRSISLAFVGIAYETHHSIGVRRTSLAATTLNTTIYTTRAEISKRLEYSICRACAENAAIQTVDGHREGVSESTGSRL